MASPGQVSLLTLVGSLGQGKVRSHREEKLTDQEDQLPGSLSNGKVRSHRQRETADPEKAAAMLVQQPAEYTVNPRRNMDPCGQGSASWPKKMRILKAGFQG